MKCTKRGDAWHFEVECKYYKKQGLANEHWIRGQDYFNEMCSSNTTFEKKFG